MSVHIRVVTPVIPTGMTQPSDFEGILSEPDRLSYVEIDAGPASIESEFDEMLAAPDTVAKIIEAEADGVDAVVIDCMGDPGLIAARKCVAIPVLGPCETSMNLACMIGHRFSVLAVTENMRAQFDNHARLYGAMDKYASTRSVEIPVLELNASSEVLRQALLAQATKAITVDHADTMIIGCTGMIGVAERLRADLAENGFDVPVVDPIPTSVRIAKALVLSGLSHSKRAYPKPSKKLLSGYAQPALNQYSQE